ncbi:hypothetical protein, partial [Streptomyces sp. NPDC058279]|uniref:hypothetical protein n=1 Tax=Streptomyces sp. NPDC058279 TaxID=3346418 RepID=UPI0036DFB564
MPEPDRFGRDGLKSLSPQELNSEWVPPTHHRSFEAGKSGGKVLIESDSPKRESAKALEPESEPRFDRESDTKESDRVGNARTKRRTKEAP